MTRYDGKKIRFQRMPDVLTNRDLSEEVTKNLALPSEDSPGDSADDELQEISIGMDFSRDPVEEEEDLPLAERRLRSPVRIDEKLSEDLGVQSSSRPDPLEDLDSSTSTH